MTNLHTFGQALTDAMRPDAAGHDVRIKIGTTPETDILRASSGPVGQELLTEFGISFSTQNRVFFVTVAALAAVGITSQPDNNWFVIDTTDNTQWRVLPDGDDHYWRWHGQHRQAYRLLTKMDS